MKTSHLVSALVLTLSLGSAFGTGFDFGNLAGSLTSWMLHPIPNPVPQTSSAPTYQSLGQATSSILGGGQVTSLLSKWEQDYCEPASFTPSEEKPATFRGPAMVIDFKTGGCTFDDHAYFNDGAKELNCTKPSITYVKAPANFTCKYHTAPEFTTKECKMKKEFGEPEVKVLYTFEEGRPVDLHAIAAALQQEIAGLIAETVSGLGSTVGTVAGGVKTGVQGVGNLVGYKLDWLKNLHPANYFSGYGLRMGNASDAGAMGGWPVGNY